MLPELIQKSPYPHKDSSLGRPAAYCMGNMDYTIPWGVFLRVV